MARYKSQRVCIREQPEGFAWQKLLHTLRVRSFFATYQEAAPKLDLHHRYPRNVGVLRALSTIYRIDDAVFGN